MMESLISNGATSPAMASDYHRIEKVLDYLHSHYLEQPDLATMARAAHLSEYHFQRVFKRWAGISPKRFIQFLTLEHAKRQLAGSKAVLDAALDSGLSGPGRLHELFVSVEAVTPGEFKTRGAGIKIAYGFHSSPFGACLLGATGRGVCWLSFVDGAGRHAAFRDLKSYWNGASFEEQPAVTKSVATQIFSPLEKRRRSSLGLLLMGTNFQIKVWHALLKVPVGNLVCYQTLGEAVGMPEASRAVGAAVGRNPIAYLIPCHRVIRKSGMLGGYHWGESRKRAILGWEASQMDHKSQGWHGDNQAGPA